jgi:hypothetical protein
VSSKGFNQTINSILILAGAFIFAFLFGEFVHDCGHYLCHLAYGNTQVKVHFDPFGGTRIIGAQGLPHRVLAVTCAAGPLVNLILGLSSFFLLWKIRRPLLLPLILWGPVALIQEGVTFSMGLLTPGGDAEWIETLGIPPLILLTNGVTFLIIGSLLVDVLLDLAGIKQNDPFGRKLLIIFTSMCSLMLIRSIHSFLVTPSKVFENLIPLVFSVLLAIFTAAIHRPISKMMDMVVLPNTHPVSRNALTLALILGTSTFVIQLIMFN